MSLVKQEANLLSRLDRVPLTTPLIIFILVLLILGWMFESFDIGIAGALIVSLKTSWHLQSSQVALLGVSTTLGIVVGLIPGGRLSDRFGRKRMLIFGITVFSIFTFLSAFSQGYSALILLRIIAGIGEGLVFPIPYLMLSEFANSTRRGTSLGWVNGVLTAAYFVPLTVAAYVTHHVPLQNVWKIMSMLGGIPLIYTIILLIWLPESPRILLKNGQHDKLEHLVTRLERNAHIVTDPEFINPSTLRILEAKVQTRTTVDSLFRKPYLGRSIASYLVFLYGIYVFYILNVYGPTMFSDKGLMNVGNALNFTAVMMLIGGIGTVVHGYISDRYGRKGPLVIYALLALVGVVLFIHPGNFMMLGLAGLLAAFFGLAINAFGKLYMSEQYPTEVRGLGVATGEMIGRFISGVMGLYFVPFLLKIGGTTVIFATLAVFIVLANIPLIMWGRNTSNMSVEEAGSSMQL